MKPYTLFDFDESKVDSSFDLSADPSHEELMTFGLQEIDNIVKNIETFQQDDEDIFNSIYRRSTLISGLMRINKFHELHHMLEILVFCTDFLRHSMQKKSVKRIPHEINYIINLITNSTVVLINERMEGRAPTIVFSDILDECKHYLKDTITLIDDEAKKAETSSYTKIEQQETLPELKSNTPNFQKNLDEEEIINIPHDKIGFISDYCEESREILGNIELQLIELEGNEEPLPIVNQIYKGLTNLKDSAKSLSIMKIESLANANQALVQNIRDGNVLINSDLVDILLYSKKTFERMINDIASRRPITVPINAVIQRCLTFLEKETSGSDDNDGKDDETMEGEETLSIPDDKVGFISDYCEESREILGNMGLLLVQLETENRPTQVVNEIFRGLHTLKGSAKLLNLEKIEKLAHSSEALLDKIRKEETFITPDIIDILLESKSVLERMVSEVASRKAIKTPINAMINRINNIGEINTLGEGTENLKFANTKPSVDVVKEQHSDFIADSDEQKFEDNVSPLNETIRITTDKLDDVLNVASEVFITRIRLQNDISTLNSSMGLLKSNLVDQGLDQLSVAEFLANIKRSNQENSEPDVGSNKLRPSLVSKGNSSSEKQRMQQSALDRFVDVDTEKKKLEKSISDLEELSGRLQSSAMNIRMVPVRYAFDRFPVQVRETARGLNKKVRLTVSGADTELDKLLINQLIEPMLHILRNAVDHGIEPPEERKELGKNDTALIKISAYYQGSEAVIEIADDGRGIDTDNVYQKAKTLGLIDAENRDHLSREDILNLIFEPGFSTSKEVTTLSGRGVGMDAVRRAISQVHGTVTVDSVLSEGSTFKIRLPLSLAVAGVLLVTEYKYKFAFPVLHVEDILTVSSDQIELISQTEIFNYRGEALPVTTLSNILNFKGSDFNEELVTIVILSDDGKKKCVKVDSVLGRQDVIIKNLGDFIRHAPSVMGCTILSDNQLILILNSWEIVNSKKELNRYRA